jgi:hypothetical protein
MTDSPITADADVAHAVVQAAGLAPLPRQK